MSRAALDLTELQVRDQAGNALVSNVTVHVPESKALVIVGETGSGKSLVAQAILGLLPPKLSASGTVRIGSRDPVSLAQGATLRLFWSKDVILLPQDAGTALDPVMRIGRQLANAGRYHNASIAEVLESVDLAPNVAEAYPFALSGGMNQRVLVATSLLSSAPLVIADEPTKGLDKERVTQAIALMRSLMAAGRSLVVITHDMAVARGLDGTVAVMKEGRIIESGPANRILATPREAYTRDLIDADPAKWPSCPQHVAGDHPVLTAQGLSFAYRGGAPLFRAVDVHVARGGVLALVGPSGCGKTTLGNVLLGLQRPSAGSVMWDGINPYLDPSGTQRLRRRYQKLHQDPATAFAPHRTIGRQLADLGKLIGGFDPKAALPPLLDRLRLNADLLKRYPVEISGGEVQRLALARVLLLDPHLIVADEPTSRLDPLVQKQTIRLLRQFVGERGLGLLLISHDRALVRAVADGILDLGT